MTGAAVIHGHFYQPPREDPWLRDVPAEPSAAPFHDWNGRITHECYRPLLAARVLDPKGEVARTLNLYEWMSFDVGPTLMSWLEAHAHDVYQGMREADRASAARLGGHGNAIAHPHHHIILPLASRRDKLTEVRWGLDDFRAQFGRDAEGFWMPETAMDEETLDVLAECGVRFTVVAPTQVENPPADGRPLRFRAGGGREIALFAYDGALAADIAFGELLRDGVALGGRLAAPPATGAEGAEDDAGSGTISFATDGETFGHHHKFGEMALAKAVDSVVTGGAVAVENYASILARTPPTDDARLVAPSAWSCAHGVERWRSDCGCHATDGTSQAWRAPLREALDWLAGALDARFTGDENDRRADPWYARLAMFTSCGWFFDDIAGHETMLILRQAAYAIDKLGDAAMEEAFMRRLARAQSNDPDAGDGAAVYRRIMDARRVLA